MRMEQVAVDTFAAATLDTGLFRLIFWGHPAGLVVSKLQQLTARPSVSWPLQAPQDAQTVIRLLLPQSFDLTRGKPAALHSTLLF
jgi:hypothetical protein